MDAIKPAAEKQIETSQGTVQRPKFYYAARAVCRVSAQELYGTSSSAQKKVNTYVEDHWMEHYDVIKAAFDEFTQRQVENNLQFYKSY